MGPTRILIADDHKLLRRGLTRLLEFEQDVIVVGEAANGYEAVAQTIQLRPDVILMDINMPGKNGIEATREIKAVYPNAKILALTIHEEEEYVSEMMKAGAKGYLLKDAEPQHVVLAISQVVQGETYFPPQLMEKVVRYLQSLGSQQEKKQEETFALTLREKEVLQCIVEGLSNKEIATSLSISEKTVKNHLTGIFRKLDVQDRTQAAVFALKHAQILD